MKKRKKRILSRSGVEYMFILDDDLKQVKIVWVSSNSFFDRIFFNRKKKKIQDVLDSTSMNLEMVEEEQQSVTYACSKEQQRKVLKTFARS